MKDKKKLLVNSQLKEKSENGKFNLSGAILYGINVVIGSGIFLLPQSIYQYMGPSSLVVMLIDVILVLMLAICFAEVSSFFDKNGGAFQYSKSAFGNFTGFIIGLLGWFVSMVAWSAMASAFSKLLILNFPCLESKSKIISIMLVIILSIMNANGLKTSKVFTTIITIAKLIPIIGFVICSLLFFKRGISSGNFMPFLQLKKGMELSKAIAATSLTTFYAFVGFEVLPVVAGEMRNAKRNVPKAIIGSISIVSILYFITIFGTISMLGQNILNTKKPVQDAFEQMIGSFGSWIISIGALISVLGVNVGDSLMSPRYGASISNEGLLPKFISKNNKYGTPYISIIISGIITVLLLLFGNFRQLAELSVVFRFSQYIPTALAVIFLRKRISDFKTSFRIPLGPTIPIISIIMSLWMLFSGARIISLIFVFYTIIIAMFLYWILNFRKYKKF